MTITILILLCIFFGFNLYTNYFHYKWFALSILSGLCLSYYLYADFGPFVPALLMYCLGSSLYVGMFNVNKHFAHPPKGLNATLAMQTTKSGLALMSLFVVYIFLDNVNLKELSEVIKILLAINCAWTILPSYLMDKLFKFKTERGDSALVQGFGANVSVNATLLSLMAPFAFIDFQSDVAFNSMLLIAALAAIVKTTASTGLIAFICSTAFFFVMEYELNIQISALVFISFSALAIYVADKWGLREQKRRGVNPKCYKRVWDLSGRDKIWKFSRDKVRTKSGRFFGIGVGAYHFLMPHMQTNEVKGIVKKRYEAKLAFCKNNKISFTKEQQIAYQQKVAQECASKLGPRYVWMHADLFQFGIEGGYFGLALLVSAAGSLILMGILTGNLVVLSFLIAYFINSLSNFPNHLAPDSLLVIIMLKFLAVGV